MSTVVPRHLYILNHTLQGQKRRRDAIEDAISNDAAVDAALNSPWKRSRTGPSDQLASTLAKTNQLSKQASLLRRNVTVLSRKAKLSDELVVAKAKFDAAQAEVDEVKRKHPFLTRVPLPELADAAVAFLVGLSLAQFV